MRIKNLALISVVAVLLGGSSAAMADGYGYPSQPGVHVTSTTIVQLGGGYAPRRCDPVFGCPTNETPTDEVIDQTHTHRERHWDR